MSFYPDFIYISSRFCPKFIQVFSYFLKKNLDKITIKFGCSVFSPTLSRFSPYFLQIFFRFLEIHFIQILSVFNLDKIRIKSGKDLDKRTWKGLLSQSSPGFRNKVAWCMGIPLTNCFFFMKKEKQFY
jgi:hypothetical protein